MTKRRIMTNGRLPVKDKDIKTKRMNMAKKTDTQGRSIEPKEDNTRINPVALTITIFIFGVAILSTVLMDNQGVADWLIGTIFGVLLFVGLYILLSLKIASQWEKAVVLRLGKFRGLTGPGLFWIVPIVEAVAKWIDHRVMGTPFSAAKTLTRERAAVEAWG